MRWPSLLVHVRHAQSVGNTLGRDARATIPEATHAYPLTDDGRVQAKKTGEYLRSVYGNFDAYYVSYYERALETARLACPFVHRFKVDSRLAEAQRGIYHTMTRAEIEAKYPEENARKKKEGLYHYRPPGGENWPDIELRVRSFMSTLKEDHNQHRVLIVGHGHWHLMFEKILFDWSIDKCVGLYPKGVVANASVTAYTRCGFAERESIDREYLVPWETEESKINETKEQNELA